MDAVDTNVLVRYLLQDDPEKGPAAARLLDGAEGLGVSLIALAETAFVLARVYGVCRGSAWWTSWWRCSANVA